MLSSSCLAHLEHRLRFLTVFGFGEGHLRRMRHPPDAEGEITGKESLSVDTMLPAIQADCLRRLGLDLTRH